jgi:hypothetical protein
MSSEQFEIQQIIDRTSQSTKMVGGSSGNYWNWLMRSRTGWYPGFPVQYPGKSPFRLQEELLRANWQEIPPPYESLEDGQLLPDFLQEEWGMATDEVTILRADIPGIWPYQILAELATGEQSSVFEVIPPTDPLRRSLNTVLQDVPEELTGIATEIFFRADWRQPPGIYLHDACVVSSGKWLPWVTGHPGVEKPYTLMIVGPSPWSKEGGDKMVCDLCAGTPAAVKALDLGELPEEIRQRWWTSELPPVTSLGTFLLVAELARAFFRVTLSEVQAMGWKYGHRIE